MKLLTALCFGGAYAIVASPVFAGDKVEYAPASSWVKPVALPKPSATSAAAVELLLSDSQISMKPGAVETYAELAFYIRNPQGLSAGNIQFPWHPETDRLIVHKVQIRRGSQLIDVLAKGQTFTVIRRESNLESAMLDGVLTATLHPEGLQVGDIINFAVTMVQSDPVLKGHVEQAGGLWNGFPVAKAHLRVAWPANVPVRLRQSPSLPPLNPVDQDGMKVVDLTLDDVQPLNLPKGAPLRYQIGRIAEFSDFASWADMATLLAPLYEKASALPPGGKLVAEVARIKAKTADPVARAEAALALVQDRVRYVALLMGQGGLVPADAETSWERRFADCKGKTAMLLGLLHALGIAADPVVVNLGFGDGIDKRLPMVGLFNHVIVRATIGGKTYWLDGTHTGDTKLSQIEVPNLRWGLPLVKDAALVPIMPPAYDQPHEWTEIQIDARAGLTVPAPIKVETVTTGDEAVASNVMFTNMTADVRDRTMRDFWRGQFDSIDIKAVGVRFDPVKREQHFTVDGTTTMDWSDGRYEADQMGIGYKADFVRENGPDRDAPFAVGFPYHSRATEVILLPPGFSEADNIKTAELNETIAGIEYRRHASLQAGTFKIEKTERSVAPEFAAKDAPAAQIRLRQLADSGIYLRRPQTYRRTESEKKLVLENQSTDAEARYARAEVLHERGDCKAALVELDAVMAEQPGERRGLISRAQCRMLVGEPEEAAADIARLREIAPDNALVRVLYANLLITRGDPTGAIAEFDAALKAVPDYAPWLADRARAHERAGHSDLALADANAALAREPRIAELYLIRANAYRRRGDSAQARAQADMLIKAMPDDSYALVVAARIYERYDMRTKALEAFDRAIAIKPEAYIYINRANVRTASEQAAKLADIEAALKLDPMSVEARYMKYRVQRSTSDFAGAKATLDIMLTNKPTDITLLVDRGAVHVGMGNAALAAKDFDAAYALAKTPSDLNQICWEKAVANVDLAEALKVCDEALAKEPGASAFMDSRGMVLLRMGRIDDAIEQYDRALVKTPNETSSLYGRAIAWARKGDKAKSDADAAKAIKLRDDVANEFREYGLAI